MWFPLVTRQICKRFRPKSYESCPHLWSQPHLLSVPSSLQICRKWRNKNFVFNISPHRKVNGNRGGQAIVPQRTAPLYDSMMPGRISKQLCASGMPSGGLNENLRARRNVWNSRDPVVNFSSEIMTADFCIIDLWMPFI
jgi:hypothetical protein